MLLHLAMRRRAVHPPGRQSPGSAPLARPLEVLARGDRCHRPVRQPGRRPGLAGRDHHGRLPAGVDPPARQRRRHAPRSALLGLESSRSACSWPGSSPTPSRASTRSPRRRPGASGRAALTCLAWMILYRVIDVGGLPGLVDPRPTRRGQSAGRLLPAPDHRRGPADGRAGRCRPEVQGTRPIRGWWSAARSAWPLFVCAATGLLGRLGLRMRL